MLLSAFHRKLNDNGPTVSRIFTKSTSVLSRSGISISPSLSLPLLSCNSKLEAKETETTSKIRGKWNAASYSFYKAIRAGVVCLETMLGINPIGIDLVIEGLPLYACSSELSPAHGCNYWQLQGYWLPIMCVSGAYGRSYLTRVAFRINQKDYHVCIQRYR